MSLSDYRFDVTALDESDKKVKINWIYLEGNVREAVRELKKELIKEWKAQPSKFSGLSCHDEMCPFSNCDCVPKIEKVFDEIFGSKLT